MATARASTSAAPKERPIPFTDLMVDAILNGRKSQTRRIIKNADWLACLTGDCPHETQRECDAALQAMCPYGVPGDRLWIKTAYRTRFDAERNQTFWSIHSSFITTHGQAMSGTTGNVKRDGNHPAMFMPYWLSQELRLPLLEITGVRAERLRDISERDAKAEGVYPGTMGLKLRPHQLAFKRLWHTIHAHDGPKGWDANPWVWVISFGTVYE